MSNEHKDDSDADFALGGTVEDGGDFVYGNVAGGSGDPEDPPSLTVYLVDEDGDPVDGLVVFEEHYPAWTDEGTGRARYEGVEVGDTVRVRAEELPAGYPDTHTITYRVSEHHDELTITVEQEEKSGLPAPYRDWETDSSDDDSSSSTETEEEDDETESDGKPALTIRVEDADDGSPISGATVWTKWDGGIYETGPDGSITFEDIPEVQKHFVGVSADGYEKKDYIGIVVLDTDVEETISLEPKASGDDSSADSGASAAETTTEAGEEAAEDASGEGLSPSEVGSIRDALLKVEAIEEVNLHADGSGELHFSAGHMEVKGDSAQRSIQRALPAAYDIQLGQGRMRRDGNLSLDFDISKA